MIIANGLQSFIVIFELAKAYSLSSSFYVKNYDYVKLSYWENEWKMIKNK